MPRKFGQIYCAIWDDPDFLLLTAGAQRTYLFLVTQDDITACGSLPLRLRRWSKKCIDSSLEVWLAELTDTEFVLLDEDTEEVLVRSFARHDEGYKHTIRRKAVLSSARAIKSPLLSACIAAELAKVGLSTGTAEAPQSGASATPEPAEPQRFQVVTEGDLDREPGTSIPEQGTVAAGDALSPFCSKHPKGTDKNCMPCGTARLRFQAWERGAERRVAAVKAAKVATAAACPRCKGSSLIEDENGKVIGKCDPHISPLTVVPSSSVGAV